MQNKDVKKIVIICVGAVVGLIILCLVVGAFITNGNMNNTEKHAECINNGGIWNNGKCEQRF